MPIIEPNKRLAPISMKIGKPRVTEPVHKPIHTLDDLAESMGMGKLGTPTSSMSLADIQAMSRGKAIIAKATAR